MKRRVTNLALALVYMVFILSGAVVVTLAFKPLYYFDIEYLHIPATSGYPKEEIKENYERLIDYNLSPFADKLEFSTLPMSEEGEIHFREVRDIFQLFLRLFLICGVLAAAGALWKRKRKEYGYLKWAGVFTLVLPLLGGCFVAVNWERAFVTFHEIAFSNDYWLFDPAVDPVINILPNTFFFHCAVLILVLAAVGAGGCLVAWSRKKRHTAAVPQV